MAVRTNFLDVRNEALNGPQTTGRDYRNLSAPEYEMTSENDVRIAMRDGTVLLADIRRPAGVGRFPALLAAAPYPRQMQDLGAPAGVVEAGDSEFWTARGYVHVIVNLRGTSGSGGTWTFFDDTERQDMYDLVEWVAAQPWCDGNVGGMGISYYAMTQLAAATQQPPHLKAIFPFDVSVDAWDAAWHNGLFSSGFITPWVKSLGVLAGHGDRLYRRGLSRLARRILHRPAVHRRFACTGGPQAIRGLRAISRFPRAAQPWDDLWRAMAVEHQTRDAWWDERNLTPLLSDVRIPVYLGSEWPNVPLHLNGTLAAWTGLQKDPHVRMAILPEHGLPWPWESMHVEALAWFDHWLRGLDTGIMDGPRVRWWMPGAEEWRATDEWPPPADHRELPLGGEDRRYATFDSPGLPQSLTWTGDPQPEDLDVAGPIELRLDATITADDTGWIVLIRDVAPDGAVTDVTQGWLRAALRTVDEAASAPGRPVLPLRTPVPVPAGEPVTYRIPLVPNARRFARGHRIRVTVTSDDSRREAHAMMLFSHTPIGTRSINTVHASSRLLLPVLSGRR